MRRGGGWGRRGLVGTEIGRRYRDQRETGEGEGEGAEMKQGVIGGGGGLAMEDCQGEWEGGRGEGRGSAKR